MTTQPTDQGLDRPATNDATAQALVRAIPDPIFRIGVDGVYRGFKVDNERDLLTPADKVIGHSVHERRAAAPSTKAFSSASSTPSRSTASCATTRDESSRADRTSSS